MVVESCGFLFLQRCLKTFLEQRSLFKKSEGVCESFCAAIVSSHPVICHFNGISKIDLFIGCEKHRSGFGTRGTNHSLGAGGPLELREVLGEGSARLVVGAKKKVL